MKEYELTVMFHPDLEMNLEPALDKVKKLIETNKGKIIKEEVDGKKHIAYPIDGQNFAIYHYFTVELPAEAPNKISGTLNITDEVLRYLLVRADGRRQKTEEAKATKKVTTEKGE